MLLSLRRKRVSLVRMYVCMCVRGRVGCHHLLLGLPGCVFPLPLSFVFPLLPARLIRLMLTGLCNSCKTFYSTASFHAFFTPALSLCCVWMLVYKSTEMHSHTHTHIPSVIGWGWVSRPNIIIISVWSWPLSAFPWWRSHNLIYGEVL